jgi:hypothetical protein
VLARAFGPNVNSKRVAQTDLVGLSSVGCTVKVTAILWRSAVTKSLTE